ncbi:MAG: alcohol dehydrogenase catalytic domain-containing protein [Candidatus Coatesbacteria bacterium]|nr:alcohol dehydrogenase catalytic domain-containing protein [Candidatus Coatesbacteria bacterium]
MMKAVRKMKRERGAELVQVPVPTIKPHEVLVKVRATSICGTDVSIYDWNAWAENRIRNVPQTMGHEFAGDVVETGSAVRRIKVGDYISAETHIPCFNCPPCLNRQFHICSNLVILGVDGDGCFAEYAAIPEDVCWVNEKSIPPEFACVQEPLGNATYTVCVEPVVGKSVIIFGDGPTGLFATGVARVAGASLVATIGRHNFRLDIAKKMGADLALNEKELGLDGVEKAIRDALSAKFYDGKYGADVVLDMVGTEEGIALGLKLVRKGGRFSAFGVAKKLQIPFDYNNGIVFKGVDIRGINGRIMYDTWYTVKNLLASGRLNIEPVVTHKLPLDEFEKGFALMMDRPKVSGKVVFML